MGTGDWGHLGAPRVRAPPGTPALAGPLPAAPGWQSRADTRGWTRGRGHGHAGSDTRARTRGRSRRALRPGVLPCKAPGAGLTLPSGRRAA